MKRVLTHLLMQNLSLGEYDSSKQLERQYYYQSNVTREPMFIMWWLLFVHKKAASIPNVQSILITIMHFLIHLCTHLHIKKHRSPF